MRVLLLVLPLIAVAPARAASQDAWNNPGTSEIFRTIASLDRALFDAFNSCDLEKLRTFFTEDLEFYHDRTGLALGRDKLIDATRNNICGKVRRELVASTMEVHSIEGYGALQMGAHLFHHPGREETEPTGQGKFVHLWKQMSGAWKITRVISYDHRPASDQEIESGPSAEP